MRSGIRGMVGSPYGRVAVAVLLSMATTAILLATPFALGYLSDLPGADWARLSDVAETFGAIATLIGALTLGGVAVSLMMQARDNKLNREQARRGFHLNLYAMAFDDPALLECWGEVVPPSYSHDEHRQHVYVNQIVSFWSMLHKVDELPEDELRQLAAALFKREPGRRYWHVASTYRRALRGTRRTREFVRVVDDEYQRATAGRQGTSEHQPASADPLLAVKIPEG
ncbi:DUF6082 family protein [Catellatospora citrea]|uniref:Uncharacterized protein n=1 Tax=Catellatospora citrea TaxID=53366 RepID=A0A8J3NWD9_9ACTN|nr:DUF6082 family protein [Catellatospora citrea]RKE06975.1 hypothetical protein C8E86_1799 [Catellatospora citrea]GIF95125.1 hypothetical protein Cci01nite_02190 [Catellatospora citrea]